MFRTVFFIVVVFLSLSHAVQAQNILENYIIHLNDLGKSANDKVPIIFEEKIISIDTLYNLAGNYATKESKKFKKSNKYSSIKDFITDINEYLVVFDAGEMFVDISQEDGKIILTPRYLGLQKALGANNRMVIDVSKGVIIDKESFKFSALTIPFKAYLTNNSDSLANFTNNIETNVNVAFSFGKNWEKHSFRQNLESKLRSHHYLFGFLGANKLTLNEKNTDSSKLVSDDVILTFSYGFGYQIGFNRLGLSFVLGLDAPTSALKKEWVFRNQPWIGIGVGYDLFKQ